MISSDWNSQANLFGADCSLSWIRDSISMEEGKDPNVVNRVGHSRVLPHRLLRLLVPFVLCSTFSVVSIYMIRYFGANSTEAILRPRLYPALKK